MRINEMDIKDIGVLVINNNLLSGFVDAYLFVEDTVSKLYDYTNKIVSNVIYDKVSDETGLTVDELKKSFSNEQICKVFEGLANKGNKDTYKLFVEHAGKMAKRDELYYE